jgi:hypothetical protein
MKLAELETKLLAVARSVSVSEAVPYAFQKRIMTQIHSRTVIDQWAWWGRALWRAAAPCVAIVLILSAWTLYAPNSGTDLSQELENTVMVAVQQQPDSAW